MKLSIIITVYNKANFLRRAMNALLNQQGTLDSDYEIIAVNDGSTDDSAAILEEYAQSDNRVRILSQQNQGLSMARNNGVGFTRGEYIWFVDADDTFSSCSVNLICKATESHPDIIPIYAITDGLTKVRNKIDPSLKTGRDILVAGSWQHCGVFWVFRKAFLLDNKLSFLPGIYHEDAEFTPRMLFFAESAKVVPEVLYTVFRDPDSITQVPRPKRAFDCLIIAKRLLDFFEHHKDGDDAVERIMNYRISMIINDALFVITQNSQEEQHNFDKTFQSMPELLKPLINSTAFRYRLEALLFSIFPGHYSIIYRFLKKFA